MLPFIRESFVCVILNIFRGRLTIFPPKEWWKWTVDSSSYKFFSQKFKPVYFWTFGDLSCSFLTQHLGLSYLHKKGVDCNCRNKMLQIWISVSTCKGPGTFIHISYSSFVWARRTYWKWVFIPGNLEKFIACFTKRTLLVVSSLITQTSL